MEIEKVKEKKKFNKKEYNANYYIEHKEAVKKYQKQKVKCECCNTTVSMYNLSKHRKTIKHKYQELLSQMKDT